MLFSNQEAVKDINLFGRCESHRDRTLYVLPPYLRPLEDIKTPYYKARWSRRDAAMGRTSARHNGNPHLVNGVLLLTFTLVNRYNKFLVQVRN